VPTQGEISQHICNVLLIGDWVIDDNWVIGAHQSPISTNTGRELFRSLHHPANSLQRFCGAARVAALLHAATRTPIDLSVQGLGLWHPDDTGYFREMFQPASLLGHTPYTLHRSRPRPPISDPRISLINFAPVAKAIGYKHARLRPQKLATDDIEQYFGTTHIFRCYQQDRGKVKQLNRIDWELTPKKEDGIYAWMQKSDIKKSKVAHAFENMASKIQPPQAVIIKDLGKGLVSYALLQSLIEISDLKLRDVPWYISTKIWDAPWLELLRQEGIRVRLILYPQVAFRQNSLVPSWATPEGLPTEEAVASLYTIAKSFYSEVNNNVLAALVGPRLRAMLMELTPHVGRPPDAGYKRPEDLSVFVNPQENPNKIDFNNAVGNASAFFAALVFGFLHRHITFSNAGLDARIESGVLFKSALDASQNWIAQECRWLDSPQPSAMPSELVMTMKPTSTKNSKSANSYVLDTTAPKMEGRKLDPVEIPDPFGDDDWDQWQQAMTGLGIITAKVEKPAVQIRRACIEFPEYICLVPAKRKALARLRDEIVEFRPSRVSRPISGLLVSRPGAGKSHFVKRLEMSLNLKTLSYNITTLSHRDDLLACFDQIVTTQSELTPEDKLLVFFDEINAHFAGHSVYDVFLAPLEDGYYIRRSFKFHIRPCIWLFAGTVDGEGIKKDAKGSDFISRLTMGQIDLTLNSSEYPEIQKTERVYLGLSLARAAYSDLTSVRKRVLRVLSELKPGLSTRDIRRFVERNLAVSRGQGDWKKVKRIYLDNEECFGFGLEERTSLQDSLLRDEEGEGVIRIEYN